MPPLKHYSAEVDGLFRAKCSHCFIELPLLAATAVLLCLELVGLREECKRWEQAELVAGIIEYRHST